MSSNEAYFIKKHPEAQIPKYFTKDAAACDLFLLEDLVIYPQSLKIVGTGLIAIPPLGYHWEVVLRSSMAVKNRGLILANSIGIIDSDYSGVEDELKILLYNTNQITYDMTKTFHFKKGERIAQLILRENLQPVIKEMSEELFLSMRNESRLGLGSTGV